MVKGQGYREPLEQRVLDFIREHFLLPAQQQLVVAVSGGPDSVCLLYILDQLREKLNIKLHVAHLNHQLRGAESEADAQYVYRLAQQLGIPATIEQRDVKAYQARQHTSLEEAAREVRYTFLAEVANSIGADRVAVGHTTDDHIETVLMHLIRGTGTRGLRGLQPSTLWQLSGSSLTIIRPLLTVTRQETLAYCHGQQLIPRMDTSNLSLSPLRNKIRHQLLPLLNSYNPRVTEALLRTARIAGDDLSFLDRESARLWSRVADKQKDTITLDKARFLELPSALQRYLLRTAIEGLVGNIKDVEARHIEAIMAALTKSAGKRLNLPRGLVFTIEYDRYLLGLDAAALSPLPTLNDEYTLNIPGETVFPGWRVTATMINHKPTAEKDNDLTAYFDLDKTGSQITVRCRRPGDRFQPLGMSQPKKLGEFMIDAKIPRAWRGRVPVVCSPEQILWVVGYRTDDRVKVTQNTRRVLCLEFESASDSAIETPRVQY